MSEKRPSTESAPKRDPYQVFEALTKQSEWSPETEEKLTALFESHQEDLYMIYLNYRESGLVEELSEYERRLFEWLEDKFGDTSE